MYTKHTYGELLSKFPSTTAEKKGEYTVLNERHLQVMWLEQKYFNNLEIMYGENIEVLSPGIWNSGAGPDFLKAHIKIGDREIRGDIEIHLVDNGWENHKHHLDTRYNNVILHISLWKPKNSKVITNQKGKIIPQTYLESALTIPQSRIYQLIDLELYPYHRFAGTGKCGQLLFNKLPTNKTESFFHMAADWRLMIKERENRGIASALGYKNNSTQFVEIYKLLNQYSDHTEDQMISIGIGVCGFFEKKYQNLWSHSPIYQKYSHNFHSYTISTKIKLDLTQVRPLNHPIRRIVWLVKMIKSGKILEKEILGCWERIWKSLKWSELRSTMLKLIPCFEDPYWNTHYLFECTKKGKFLSLMGVDLKTKILINIIFPYLREIIKKKGNPQEYEAFFEYYRSFPCSSSKKHRYLIDRFFGNIRISNRLRSAIVEQGTYQLHKDFCLDYEASCEGCPFIEKYKKTIH